jgi:transposase
MSRRSKVRVYEQIRRAHERDGSSIRELSRRFGVHRRDVRAALADPVPLPRRPSPPRDAPVLGPWKPLIEEWLEADRAAPRKQRHTARRVWQRLVEEHGAVVSEGTVRRFVAEVRARQEVSPATVFVPQTHPLGDEAEVDFGTVRVYLAGLATDVSLFVFRLSASGKGFARAYLNEGQEVFLDGHVRAFEHLGGCPGRIRYDNLKAAVVRVLKGRDRCESDRFVALRSHYGFDSFFCQPGIKGAHEKGGVEGEVGRFRRRHLVPVPRVGSLSELNELIAAGVARDDDRRVGYRSVSVGEHFALEAPELRALPVESFEVSTLSSHRVDRKSRVSVRNCLYSVPACYVERRLEVRLGAESVEVLDGSTRVATHPRGLKGDEVLCLDHYLEVLVHKPGALPGSTALARARAGGAFGPAHERFWSAARARLGDSDGTRALIEVLLLHRSLPHDAVAGGIEAALAAGSLEAAVVAIEARRAADVATATVVPIGDGLSRFDRPVPSVAGYDQLLAAR